MKNKFDPRHQRRIKNMQSLFTWDCSHNLPPAPDAAEITKYIPQLDRLIIANAPKWPLNQINKVDLAILRCAIWELKYRPETPPKVVIDEAVEIAKEFGTEKSSSFVNGVIGSIVNDQTDQPENA